MLREPHRGGGGSERLIVVSNREPFEHYREDGEVLVTRPAGGLVSALHPLMRRRGGTWVAWGSGNADFEVTDRDDGVRVPPERPSYRLRRVRLSTDEVQGYYTGFANESLWPLCHLRLEHFAYDPRQWEEYRRVNRKFAKAVAQEAGGEKATVWLHDYHLAQVPALLRSERRLRLHQFWHIPWPHPAMLDALPVAPALVRGLLGNHLLGFQTESAVVNFLASVAAFVPGAKVNDRRASVRHRNRTTLVRAYPISIDVAAFERLAARPEVQAEARALRRRLLPQKGHLFLGVDRMDYTKGIPRRLEAFAAMLELHPDLGGRIAYLQIAPASRSEIPAYRALERRVVAAVEAINQRFGRKGWVPVHLQRTNLDAAGLAACYEAADVCVVSSLMDGMNLVAKEYVACQRDGSGVLVLSQFTGASEELRGALLINPYDAQGSARTMFQAMTMHPRARALRMAVMRRHLHRHTVHDWMDDIFKDVEKIRR